MRTTIQFLLITLCVVAMSGVAWGQLYWRTDGTSGTWTGANWSNPASATGGDVYTANTDAFFSANSTVTFATVSIGNVTVADGVTVTVTKDGTLSMNGAIRTFDIGTGSTLTWTSQIVTANSAAGITKNGAGTLNLGALTYSTNLNGGFTLNNGTLIVSGAKALGNGTLTINGGTLQSSNSSTYAATSLTIGGDFALAGTGNDIWQMPVALGSSTRTITNNTTSGNRTYSGIISGNSGVGLTFAGSGTGIMILSGANTYTGLTTVSAGTLQLNRSGGTTIPVTNNVTVSGGTLRISSDQTVNDLTVASGATLTVDAGVTLTVNGTYSVSSSTSGNAGTITVNGTLQINQGGWPGNTGTFTYGPSAILAFANSSGSYDVGGSDTWWPSTNGPANVTVSGAGGITMNVARTVSGTLQTAAGVLNGNNLTLSGTSQINQGGYFTGNPTYGASSTLVYNNTSGSYGMGNEWPSGSGPFNVTVQGAGGVTVGSSRTVAGTFQTAAGVTNGNNLILDGTCQVNSGGFFTGSPTYGASSTLVYNNGAGGFNTSDEWPSANAPTSVTIQNSTPVTLTANRTITGTLTLTSGVVTTSSNKIIVSNATAGAVAITSGSINGTIQRSIAATDATPPVIGVNSYKFNSPLTFITPNSSQLAATISITSHPGIAPSPATAGSVVNRYLEITAPVGYSAYEFGFEYTNAENAVPIIVTNMTLFRNANGVNTPWANMGGSVTPTYGNNCVVLSLNNEWRTNWTIGDFVNPLPIQLSSFTGAIVSNRVKLDWTTVSEVNNLGFYVQRRTHGVMEWLEIDNSFVAGHGTTNVPQQYTFTENAVAVASTYYRLKQVDLDGTTHFTEPILVDSPTSVPEVAPKQFALLQNYPNPFNPSTEIKFSVEATDHAKLAVYNSLGQKVAMLFDGIAEAGQYYKVKFSADHLASGVYFYHLQSGKKNELKKLMLLK